MPPLSSPPPPIATLFGIFHSFTSSLSFPLSMYLHVLLLKCWPISAHLTPALYWEGTTTCLCLMCSCGPASLQWLHSLPFLTCNCWHLVCLVCYCMSRLTSGGIQGDFVLHHESSPRGEQCVEYTRCMVTCSTWDVVNDLIANIEYKLSRNIFKLPALNLRWR